MPVQNHRDRRSRSIGTAGQIHKILFACARGASPRSFLHPSSKMIVDGGLADRGHQVRAVTVGDNEMIETSSHLEGKTISPPNIYWKYWAPRPLWKKIVWHALENGNPRALIRMGREIRDYKPDVIITISIENIATWLAARLGKLPVVHVLQNHFLMCWRGVLFKNCQLCITLFGLSGIVDWQETLFPLRQRSDWRVALYSGQAC